MRLKHAHHAVALHRSLGISIFLSLFLDLLLEGSHSFHSAVWVSGLYLSRFLFLTDVIEARQTTVGRVAGNMRPAIETQCFIRCFTTSISFGSCGVPLSYELLCSILRLWWDICEYAGSLSPWRPLFNAVVVSHPGCFLVCCSLSLYFQCCCCALPLAQFLYLALTSLFSVRSGRAILVSLSPVELPPGGVLSELTVRFSEYVPHWAP